MAIGLDHAVVRNWRVIDELTFAPDPALSWVMGPNGSGKSSLLDALVFPSDLLRAAPATRSALRHDARGEPTNAELWAFRDLLRDPRQPADWELHFTDADDVSWRYRLVLSPKGAGFAIEAEQLERRDAAAEAWTSVLEQDPTGGRVLRGAWGEAAWVPMVYKPAEPLLARANDPLEHASVVGALRFLRGIWFVHPDPLLMRGRSVPYDADAPVDRYGRDLEGLVEATIAAFPGEFSRVIDALDEANGWRAIRAVGSGVDRRLAFEEVGGRPLLLDLASDGQLVSLWLAAVSQFPPQGWTVALLDEPAVALGHGPQRRVFSWLRELSRDVQVVAATHDEAAVNFDTRESVWRIARGRGAPPTMVRLDEDPAARRWSTLFKPGDVAVRVSTPGEE